jgi:DNA recombination protein RmuC
MDVMHGVLGVLALGLGLVAWVQWRSVTAARAEAARLDAAEEAARLDAERAKGEAAQFQSEAQRLAGELGDADARADESSRRVLELSEIRAELAARLDAAEKRHQELVADEARMKAQFEALSSRTIRESQETLGRVLAERLKAADEKTKGEDEQRRLAVEAMVKPIKETLSKTSEQITQLDERVKASSASNESLKEETARLTRALSRPEIRGQYGEIQLRRVAELAGMTSYCDFSEQFSQRDEAGQLLRPDMVVTLPNNRVIVVDAKANINAYIEAVNAPTDAEREVQLERFARHTSEQVKKLSDKKYWSLFDGKSAEFVVMFVPGDHFIDAALSRRPELLDDAAQRGVILASPSTLIGLLRAVAVGWREQALTEQAAALFELGKELHERASTAFEHADSLGKAIKASVERYNRMVGSIDTRLMPTLKKFEESGAKSSKVLAEAKPVEAEVRGLIGSEERS